jgi:SAM-dependent methyltransferase
VSELNEIFDRAAVRRQRDRAAPGLERYAFLFEETAARLFDRVQDVNRQFSLALELGCHTGQFARAAKADPSRIGTLIQADLSPAMVARTDAPRLVLDEERLPIVDGSLDLVLSNLSLHWLNDLPGALVQIRRALRQDGLFIACILGGETLVELRHALLAAESELLGGAGPRVAPMIDLRDAAGLLQRTGFALPVADFDRIILAYESPFALMAELRGLGETNALSGRQKHLSRRDIFIKAAEIYQQRHARSDDRTPATFDILYLSGWAPDPSQQTPLSPGSATRSLEQAVKDSDREE